MIITPFSYAAVKFNQTIVPRFIILSSIVSIANLTLKYLIIPLVPKSISSTNHYFRYIQDKSGLRSVVLLIPILGNIAILIYDALNKRTSEKILKQIDHPDYEGDPEELDGLLQRAAAKGNSEAMHRLAECYEKGEMFENGRCRENVVEAFKYYQKGAIYGNIQSILKMALCMQNSSKYSNINRKLFTFLSSQKESKLTEEQRYQAEYLLARTNINLARTNINSNDRSEQLEASLCLNNLIKNRNASPYNIYAMFVLAERKITTHLSREESESEALLKSAIEKDDPIEYQRLLQKAAEKNNAEALVLLGKCCQQGEGCTKDNEKAKVYFEQAAKKGNFEAILILSEFITGYNFLINATTEIYTPMCLSKNSRISPECIYRARFLMAYDNIIHGIAEDQKLSFEYFQRLSDDPAASPNDLFALCALAEIYTNGLEFVTKGQAIAYLKRCLKLDKHRITDAQGRLDAICSNNPNNEMKIIGSPSSVNRQKLDQINQIKALMSPTPVRKLNKGEVNNFNKGLMSPTPPRKLNDQAEKVNNFKVISSPSRTPRTRPK